MTAGSTQTCVRCAQPLRRGHGGALVTADGLTICYTGRLPGLADIGRRHVPTAAGSCHDQLVDVDASPAEVVVAFTAAELYDLTEHAAQAGAAGVPPRAVAQNAVVSAEIGRACARARRVAS